MEIKKARRVSNFCQVFGPYFLFFSGAPLGIEPTQNSAAEPFYPNFHPNFNQVYLLFFRAPNMVAEVVKLDPSKPFEKRISAIFEITCIVDDDDAMSIHWSSLGTPKIVKGKDLPSILKSFLVTLNQDLRELPRIAPGNRFKVDDLQGIMKEISEIIIFDDLGINPMIWEEGIEDAPGTPLQIMDLAMANHRFSQEVPLIEAKDPNFGMAYIDDACIYFDDASMQLAFVAYAYSLLFAFALSPCAAVRAWSRELQPKIAPAPHFSGSAQVEDHGLLEGRVQGTP